MNVTLVISFICLSFCAFIFFYFKWYIRRRTSASELLAEYRTEAYRLIAEIDAVTDRNLMLVEDNIKKLKTVMEETDKRVASYTREMERDRTGETIYTSLGRGIRAALKTPPEEPSSVSQPSNLSPPSARSPNFTVVRPESEPPAAPPQPQPKSPLQFSPRPPSKRQIRAHIDALVKEGLTPGEIASRLDISLAEVDLAMNLLGWGKK